MRTLALLSCLVVAVPAANAEETYTIRFKFDPDLGQAVSYRSSGKDTGSVMFTNLVTKKSDDKKGGASEFASETVVLGVEDGVPTRFLRRYDKSSSTEDGKTESKRYEGKTLYYERDKAGKYRIGIEGENTLKSSDVEKLYQRAGKPSDSDALLMACAPDKPVKIGDRWDMGVAKFAKLMDLEIDVAKSSGTAKLVKVETTGRTVFGEFEIVAALTLRKAAGLEFETPVQNTLKATVRKAIDGSSTESRSGVEFRLRGETLLGGTNKTVSVAMDGGEDSEDVRSAGMPPKIKGFPKKLTWIPAPGEWVEFIPKDRSFHVTMPGAPVEKLAKEKTGDDQWVLQADERRVQYAVARTRFENPIVEMKSIAEGVAKKYKVSKVEELKVGDATVYELKYKQGDIEAETWHRIVVRDKAMWQLLYVAMPGKSKAEDRAKFFESFKIPAGEK